MASSKLTREAVGQYNYLAAPPVSMATLKRRQKRQAQTNVRQDVTIQLIDPSTGMLQSFTMKPPKMFDTSYHQDFRRPPDENLVAPKKAQVTFSSPKEEYTAYAQSAPKENRKPTAIKTKAPQQVVAESEHKQKRELLKSAGLLERHAKVTQQDHFAEKAKARAQTSEPKGRSRVNEEFERAVINARKGDEWNRKAEVSYDVLNPEKPKIGKKTKPYGSQMENVQEQIAKKKEKKLVSRPASKVSKDPPKPPSRASTADIPMINEGVVMSRASSAGSGRLSLGSINMMNQMSRPATTASSVSSLHGDYLLETGIHDNEVLETIQEDEILGHYTTPPPVEVVPIQDKVPPPPPLKPSTRKRSRKIKKPQPPTDLFKTKGPDPRFYASKKNLRTPNEMQRFKKTRARTFMKTVEQAIPELDQRDHEVKYQPERQFLQDVRFKIRKDVKDVRDKNTNHLIDRFEKRYRILKDETATRLGDPTYIGRNPVSIYKAGDKGFQVKYPLHNRPRVTPTLGSVQRQRNLGSHAQIFNQPIAAPSWGPQKVDHKLFLPAMAQGV